MIKQRTLKNGIRVIMDPMENMDSVAIGLWTKTGAVNETAENAGISHFIEHMMFKGTNKRSALDIAQDVDRIGGQINAFTGKELTCYHIRTISSNAMEALDILLDMFVDSVFDEEEMKRERKVIKEEIKMIADTPDEDVQDMICESIFAGNPAGQSIIGTPGSLNGIDRKRILAYRKAQYTRGDIVVSIAGNFSERKLIRRLEQSLTGFRARKKAVSYGRHRYEPKVKMRVRDIEQSHLCLGVPSIPLCDDRYYAMALLTNIMGGSMSSRLFQSVREQKGLAYSVYAMNTALSQQGFFYIYAGVAHGNVARAMAAIGEELDLLRKEGITDEELAKAKEQMKSGYVFQQESVHGRMIALGRRLTLLGDVQTGKEVLRRVDQVTKEDIQQVSAMITDGSAYSASLVSDRRVSLKRYVSEAMK